MPERTRYAERELRVHEHPLDLAAAVAAAQGPSASYVVYEREGEWGVCLGAAAEVTFDGDAVHCFGSNGRQTWHADDFAASMRAALESIPIAGWRAYGTAAFELGHALHGAHFDARDEPLLRLVIPTLELRLRREGALVRALREEDLDAAADLVARAGASARGPVESRGQSCPLSAAVLHSSGGEAYRRLVSRALSDISDRKLHKVIASRIVPVAADVDLIASYVSGRRHNSPARSFIVSWGDVKLAGFSPETVLEVDDGRVSTQPLAGTRALVADELENARLGAELLSDTKELAEHALSVKLAFEELSRVCKPGSVGVTDFMSVSRRGTVQHLASRLSGSLDGRPGAWPAFQALFPAVTASGIPKREALDWIRAHEAQPRGLYAGAVLTVSDAGAMDAALILRSVFQRGSRTWLRAGAGIVAQSTPEREFEETCEKLQSVARHLVARASSAKKFVA